MNNDLDIVQNEIKLLGEHFSKYPFKYFNESDIQSDLYSRLLVKFGEPVNITDRRVWSVGKQPLTRDCITRRLHSELLIPGGRIDIVILDPNAVSLSINSKGRFGHIQLSDGKHIFIEIKASRTNRSSTNSRNKWSELIYKDLEKLSKHGNYSFMLCFDFDNLMDKESVEKLRNYSSKISVMYFISDKANNLINR